LTVFKLQIKAFTITIVKISIKKDLEKIFPRSDCLHVYLVSAPKVVYHLFM
jgi:hypothetical protein